MYVAVTLLAPFVVDFLYATVKHPFLNIVNEDIHFFTTRFSVVVTVGPLLLHADSPIFLD